MKRNAPGYLAQYRLERIARGICVRCSNPLHTKTLCVVCAGSSRRLISQGLCSAACGRPLANQSHCEQCTESRLKRIHVRMQNGLCKCGKPRVLKSSCRSCADRMVERKHGLKAGDLDIIREGIKGCQACGALLTDDRGSRESRCIDHDHATGVRRGVLCNTCNKILGLARDDSSRLRAIADYKDRCDARDKV